MTITHKEERLTRTGFALLFASLGYFLAVWMGLAAVFDQTLPNVRGAGHLFIACWFLISIVWRLSVIWKPVKEGDPK